MTFCLLLRYFIPHADWSNCKSQPPHHRCLDWSTPRYLRHRSFPRQQANPLLQLDSQHSNSVRPLPSNLLPNMRGRIHIRDELRLRFSTLPCQQSVMASAIPECTWHQYDDHRAQLQRFWDVDYLRHVLSEWWWYWELCVWMVESKQSGLEYMGSR